MGDVCYEASALSESKDKEVRESMDVNSMEASHTIDPVFLKSFFVFPSCVVMGVVDDMDFKSGCEDNAI